jgi:hypothetical protein
LEKWLDFAAALFAFSAAAFWFVSAYGDLPPMVAYLEMPENDPFFMAIKFSATMNRWAAGLSGLSALCIAIRIMVSRY